MKFNTVKWISYFFVCIRKICRLERIRSFSLLINMFLSTDRGSVHDTHSSIYLSRCERSCESSLYNCWYFIFIASRIWIRVSWVSLSFCSVSV